MWGVHTVNAWLVCVHPVHPVHPAARASTMQQATLEMHTHVPSLLCAIRDSRALPFPRPCPFHALALSIPSPFPFPHIPHSLDAVLPLAPRWICPPPNRSLPIPTHHHVYHRHHTLPPKGILRSGHGGGDDPGLPTRRRKCYCIPRTHNPTPSFLLPVHIDLSITCCFVPPAFARVSFDFHPELPTASMCLTIPCW